MLSSAISYALSKEKKGREWGEFISVCACVWGGGWSGNEGEQRRRASVLQWDKQTLHGNKETRGL